MKVLKEFQEFAVKGNVVDMAVGIIIGGAFGTIVKSLVEDIIMPPIGMLLNGVDFSKLAFVLKDASIVDGKEVKAVAINYGAFINNVISFIIVALSVFVIVKMINQLKRKEAAAPPPPPADPKKDCPFCISSIPAKATRCPQCTAELPR